MAILGVPMNPVHVIDGRHRGSHGRLLAAHPLTDLLGCTFYTTRIASTDAAQRGIDAAHHIRQLLHRRRGVGHVQVRGLLWSTVVRFGVL